MQMLSQALSQFLSQLVIGLVVGFVVGLVAGLVAGFCVAATSLKCSCCRDNLILSRRPLCVIVVATA